MPSVDASSALPNRARAAATVRLSSPVANSSRGQSLGGSYRSRPQIFLAYDNVRIMREICGRRGVRFQSRLQRIAREWTAVGRRPANLGRGRRLFATELQRAAVDFDKLQVFAAHFGQDCRGLWQLWQGKPLYFKGNRCSQLWKLTGVLKLASSAAAGLWPVFAEPRRERTGDPS
jgi:hypothetical protein